MVINRIKIITLMAEKRVTGKMLSEMSGISRATIGAVRSGKTCAYDTAKALAKALGVDVTEIIQEDEV